MYCFSMIFPTRKKQFLIKHLTLKHSVPIKPFLPQQVFPLELTLVKGLLSPQKTNLSIEKIHQEACLKCVNDIITNLQYSNSQKLDFIMKIFSLIKN